MKLALGRIIHGPEDPTTKMFIKVLATFAEFEAILIRLGTQEGIVIPRAIGKLRGRQLKLSQER